MRLGGALVITGGLGGLGLRAAKELSGDGCEHAIVLASRSAKVVRDGQGLEEALTALRRACPRLQVQAYDVAQANQVKHLTHLSAEPLRGVIHAAGLLRDRLVANVRLSDLQAVLGPKACGAWHLHNAATKLPLDFLVFYSSVTATHGAAARRRLSLPLLHPLTPSYTPLRPLTQGRWVNSRTPRPTPAWTACRLVGTQAA